MSLPLRPFAFARLSYSLLAVALVALLATPRLLAAPGEKEFAARAAIFQILLAPESDQPALIEQLASRPHPVMGPILEAWQKGDLFLLRPPDARPIALQRGPDGILTDIATAQPYPSSLPPGTAPLETNSRIRRAMRAVSESLALADPNPATRENAIFRLGMRQNPETLPLLKNLLADETHPSVRTALNNAIAVIQLASPKPAEKIAALGHFEKNAAVFARDLIQRIAADSSQPPEVHAAARSALRAIERRIFWTDFNGTVFRGISLGSVLLVCAMGLAITFGLMGVINMAHGEIMVIGGYTVFVVQCVFGTGLALAPFGLSLQIPGMGLEPSGALYQSYFLVALPIAFLVSALVGLLIEKSIIQFLYRRPLESLLATWGVSLVLQQLFRLIFGPANVPVTAPAWLTGSFLVEGVIMNYNRIFVIAAAAIITLAVWLLLAKTPLGLLIRAVMQDRDTAACMGVRTARVNSLTFALGSGLAGLAGAFLSLLGTIGPSTGQTYIVDCFMVVVLGGVGNLFGTIISALGIGTLDQVLQIVLRNPVIGKVLVLAGIILFLQWKPTGLFSVRSRSLDEN